MKQEIYTQLANYSRILVPSKTLHDPPKEFYGGKNGYGFDDLAIAIQLNVVMRKRFFESDDYKKYR